jgi:hypothetical protein
MKLYEEVKLDYSDMPIGVTSIFKEARDGIKVDLATKRDVRIFFESHFEWMQQNAISSKVIGNTMYLWRRK